MTEYLIIENLTETLNDLSKVLSNVHSIWLSCKLKPWVQSKVTDFIVGFQQKYSKVSFNLRLWYVLKDELVKLRANRCNNSQHCWDLQWVVGRIQPIKLCKLQGDHMWCAACVASSWVNGSNIVALRFGDSGAKEMLGVVCSKVWQVSNFA